MSLYERVPAAEYLRISTRHQEYSIANQKRLISAYAQQHGFDVVRTYVDTGKSGVTVQHRSGLGELLHDVLAGSCDFKAILVYDVSRWGRFQDADEAGHYEFLCKSAGTAVRYCAEPFGSNGNFLDQLMKVLKRTMAAEYSRELGVKVRAGQQRLAQLGFRVGGPCGFGLRRLMIAKDRTTKAFLTEGEIKNLSTDRVVLALGPSDEVACVRDIYEMFLDREMTCTAIAKCLNSEGRLRSNHDWTETTVKRVLTSAKYAGVNVWGRTSSRLDAPTRPKPRSEWVIREGAFTSVIDRSVFDKAQAALSQRRARPSDEQLSEALRALSEHDKLTRSAILATNFKGKTRCTRNLRRFYDSIGYNYNPGYFTRSKQMVVHKKLRARLFAHLFALFPSEIKSRQLHGIRQVLQLDTGLIVSVLICPNRITKAGIPQWLLVPVQAERNFPTLVCRMNGSNDCFLDYHVFESIIATTMRWFSDDDRWFSSGTPLSQLSDFYHVLNRESVTRGGKHQRTI